MSEEIKETLTEKEAMEAIGAFANMCYDKGVRLLGSVIFQQRLLERYQLLA